MALGKNQIREANKEYYCSTYFNILGRVRCFMFAIAFVFIWQRFIYAMKQGFLKEKYTQLAGMRDLEGTEVCDWVEVQVHGNQASWMGAVVFFATLLFCGCVIATYSIKNYRLYKYKLIWSIVIFAIMSMEIIVLYLMRPEEVKGIGGDNLRTYITYIVFILLGFFTFISNLGVLLPIELKKPIEGVCKILGWMTDKLLKTM